MGETHGPIVRFRGLILSDSPFNDPGVGSYFESGERVPQIPSAAAEHLGNRNPFPAPCT